jgi:asparagine synthase (glutamine-hydrolysing)
MCGIAGLVGSSLTDTEVRDVARRMAARIGHRGPDGIREWAADGGGVGLGHARLKVIDLQTGDQPIANETGDVVTVFNGEIYNFRELRQELEGRGHRFKTKSDTEVIVHAYEEWDTDCIHRLRGMFAIALWDDKRQRLWLARDRAGQKPLVYAQQDGRMAFASELKALLELGDIDPTLDPTALELYLALLYIPAPWTIYKSVRKLPPAHWLLYENGEVKLQRYWEPEFGRPEQRSTGEWRELFLDKFQEAVRLRLVSDVPLGAFLSGGIDSSLMVATMAGLSDRPVKTFSMGFGEDINELPYARQIAERYGTEHTEFQVAPDAAHLLEVLADFYDEPYADTSNLPTFLLAKETRKHVTVALCGDGGDELFAGYGSLLSFLNAEKYRNWSDWRVKLVMKMGQSGAAYSKQLGAQLFQTPAPFGELMLRQYFTTDERASLLHPEVRDEGAHGAFLERCSDLPHLSALDGALRFNFLEYLPGDLNVKVDIASSAHGLEARAPFLDHELVELCFRIPSDQKARGGELKVILRQMIRDIVPDEILDRPKQGFGVPVVKWLRSEPFQKMIREELRDRQDLPFRHQSLEQLLDRFDGGDNNLCYRIWQLLCYSLWQRKYPVKW